MQGGAYRARGTSFHLAHVGHAWWSFFYRMSLLPHFSEMAPRLQSGWLLDKQPHTSARYRGLSSDAAQGAGGGAFQKKLLLRISDDVIKFLREAERVATVLSAQAASA